MKTVSGVVEKKGDKFNGSVQMNGEWFNFKRGVAHTGISEGDAATLTLEPWSFKGKSGMNIVSFAVTGKSEVPAQALTLRHGVGRDFDKEARGKTRCALMEALLSNPNHAETPVSDLVTRAEEALTYVFSEGK